MTESSRRRGLSWSNSAPEDDLAWLPHLQRQLGAKSVQPVRARIDENAPSFTSYEIALGAAIVTELLRGNSADPLAHSWCEKLMRFCELRRTDLMERAQAKWQARQAAATGLLSIAGVLSEAALHSGDLRYLSTALKVFDAVRRQSSSWQWRALQDRGPVISHAWLACDHALTLAARR